MIEQQLRRRLAEIVSAHSGQLVDSSQVTYAVDQLMAEVRREAGAAKIEGFSAGAVAGWDMATRQVRDGMEEPETISKHREAVKQAAIARGQEPG